jgi:hypothetical protein
MSIQNEINELTQVNAEIKRLSLQLRTLRKRAKDIESNVIDFLQQKDQPGLKYQNKAIILETKEKRSTKKRSEQEADAINVLSKYDISEPDKVLKEILESRKGSSKEISKLKIKQIKQQS